MFVLHKEKEISRIVNHTVDRWLRQFDNLKSAQRALKRIAKRHKTRVKRISPPVEWMDECITLNRVYINNYVYFISEEYLEN